MKGMKILTEKRINRDHPSEADRNIPIKTDFCCVTMQINWGEVLFFDYWENKVYISKDGGYNQVGQIDFCPFCGKRIKVEEIYET